ncbi:OleI family self-immunity macrolide glycosyltransferase [Streptomyces sp. 110]|uniref:OleI family self-immunity macrolide glycosyltransferase n=1 Tax=Streptomyces endocoffeicus TaxID=2898945 RepID=A0ABS1PR69_9ACTN|nr:OleI family self-immunity macrolide glycosyltransferase [Streptomyces endocoffeicus]
MDPSDRSVAHIAFFNIPAHGHVNPTLGTVAELVRRGHRVSYAVPAEFGPQVRATGATLVPYETTLPASDRVEDWPSDDPVAMSRLALDEAIAILPGQLRAFEADRPDLVLHDFGALTGRLLAHRWQVPVICLASTHVSAADAEERRARQEMFDEFFADDPRWSEYRREFRTFLDEAGIALSIDDYTGLPERCLVPMPREFQLDGDAVDRRYAFVGPCIGDRGHQGEWRAPADDRPVLLVALGSAGGGQPAFYREVVAAFTGTPWHVVLATGTLDPALLGPLPPNVEQRRSVPQLAVLERASAFITHGGMGSVLEAMHHGVPMVTVPQVNDQHLNAERVVDLGLGRHVPLDKVTAARLRDAVSFVASDPGIAARTAATRKRMRQLNGAVTSADLIEFVLHGRREHWQDHVARLEHRPGPGDAGHAVNGTTVG